MFYKRFYTLAVAPRPTALMSDNSDVAQVQQTCLLVTCPRHTAIVNYVHLADSGTSIYEPYVR